MSEPYSLHRVPEIRDDTQETTRQWGLGRVDVSAPEIDFSMVRFEATPTRLNASMKVLDLKHRTLPDEAFALGFTFTSEEYAFAHAEASYSSSSGWMLLFTRRTAGGETQVDHIHATVDADESMVTLSIPCGYLGATLTDVVAGSILMAPKPDGCTGGGAVWFRDVAPNSTSGPDVALACECHISSWRQFF